MGVVFYDIGTHHIALCREAYVSAAVAVDIRRGMKRGIPLHVDMRHVNALCPDMLALCLEHEQALVLHYVGEVLSLQLAPYTHLLSVSHEALPESDYLIHQQQHLSDTDNKVA